VCVVSGVNVLDNKTELRKEMDKRKQRQQRRDDEERDRLNRSTLKLRLEQQANKLNLVFSFQLIVTAAPVDTGSCRTSRWTARWPLGAATCGLPG